MPTISFLEGLLLGAGLLVALGPKDTFVIKNSLQGYSAITLVAICALSDVLLITLGVAGLGLLVASTRWAMVSAMVFSIGYLLYFSFQALRSAFASSASFAVAGTLPEKTKPAFGVVRMALFHSLLTPYAWLDTVLVIGSVSATKEGEAKIAFAAGAMLASFIWFIFLTAGARLAAPLFRARRAWQVLDLVVAVSMMALAAKLLSDYPWQIP
ncbi:L-lysine exporter family protein LysE/ArgO [Variovorax boronicumulans]|uniref:LysE/ArgO family amino acid transporter n=1 Tax=Variovorax boronicumulans TaxID=436515 RepID=UPI00159D48A7|nr:LysE family transporter [Variovorax boronicumulans]MDQ0012154.1 L-lysine exporter family protein LysE/ArgO [Variovorax boronicumulans]